MVPRSIFVAAMCGMGLVAFLTASRPATAQKNQAPSDTAASVPSSDSTVLHFTGEVMRGQIYEHDVGHGFVFRLTPAVSDLGGGWVIGILPTVEPADESLEFVEVATPPYHGYNDRYLAGAEGYSAHEAIQQTIRKFYFVQSVSDQHIASDVVNAALYPSSVSEEERNRIDTEAASLNLGSGELRILKSRMNPPKAGEPETIAWVKFEVEVNFSPGITLKSVLAPKQPQSRRQHLP
jgi:hypothetical protein